MNFILYDGILQHADALTNEGEKDKFKHLQSLRLKRKQTSFPRTYFGVWRLDLQLRGKTATSQIIRYTLK